MSKREPDADLPAPLSLTLDEISQVAGGNLTVPLSGLTVVPRIPYWWWLGQPPAPGLNGINPVGITTIGGP